MVELVDTRDLKSLGLIARTGSSPVLGTFLFYNTVHDKTDYCVKLRFFLEPETEWKQVRQCLTQPAVSALMIRIAVPLSISLWRGTG